MPRPADLATAGSRLGRSRACRLRSWLFINGVTDLTPLQGMPLQEIRLTPRNIKQGLEVLRDMKSLKTIGIDYNQAWPATEFWERYDKGEFKK
jgi:hypothetical protein